MGIKSKIKKFLNPAPVIYSPVYTIEKSNSLKGKNIVVTGGNSGIGKAIAKLSANRGAKVLIIGRRENELKKVADTIGKNTEYMVCDLSADIDEQFFNAAENKLGGKVNALVNNAGIYVDNNYLNYTAVDIDSIFKVNVKAPLILTQIFIKYCVKNNVPGNIVFTTSNRALMGDIGPYGMSKAAINNLIEGMARENILHHIRVNGVAPGMTASNINGIDPTGDLYTNSQKGKRVILPEEIAEVTCFLLSDISNCITGAIIPCDEGDRLR